MASYLDRAAHPSGSAQQPWTEEVENVDNLSTIVDKLSTWASNRYLLYDARTFANLLTRVGLFRETGSGSDSAIDSD